MSEDQRKILEMLSEGKISVAEAERLLAALSPEPESPTPREAPPISGKSGLKYLKIVVIPGPESESPDRVNIRVPLKMIRSGLKWAAFMPKDARHKVNKALNEKGLDLDINKITADDIEELVSNLGDFTVDIEGKEKVRIFCE